MVVCILNEHSPFKGSQVINEYLVFILYQQGDSTHVGGSFFYVILTNCKRVGLVCIS